MCGRYASAKDPAALVEEFGVSESLVDRPLEPDYNVAPTKPVYAITRRTKKADDDQAPRQLRIVRWGLVPSWAKDPSIGSRLINARVETVAEKPAYRRAFASRRCLLPADGYYEWYAPTGEAASASRGKPRKQPFFIHPRDGRSLAMGGLYEWWRDESKPDGDPAAWWCTATVITTTATDAVGHIHDRMPLTVERDGWSDWLDPDQHDPDYLQALLVPAAPGPLDAYPVSLAVNSVKNNGPSLLEPLSADNSASSLP